jgi:hypothetical protein
MSRRLSIHPDFTSSPLEGLSNTAAVVTVDALNRDGWKAFSKDIYSTFGNCWEKCIMFEASGTSIFSNCDVHSGELTELVKNIHDRSSVVQKGITLQGNHFDVHQHHPPMWWGRVAMKKETKVPSTGIALCKISVPTADVMDLFVLITYTLPSVSAFAVNRLQAFKTLLEGAVER